MSFHLITSRDDNAGTAFFAAAAAEAILDEADVHGDPVIRVHVPGRGEGGSGDGGLRADLEPIVPALQSVSLFGDLQAVLLLGAQQLSAAEGEALAELVAGADPEAVLLVVVAAGRPPAAFVKALKSAGAEERAIQTVRERDAAKWLGDECRRRRLQIGDDGRRALLAVFGTDLIFTRQLLLVALFIGMFSGLNFAVQVITDDAYREEFIADMTTEVRDALAVRAVYHRCLVPSLADDEGAAA